MGTSEVCAQTSIDTHLAFLETAAFARSAAGRDVLSQRLDAAVQQGTAIAAAQLLAEGLLPAIQPQAEQRAQVVREVCSDELWLSRLSRPLCSAGWPPRALRMLDAERPLSPLP